MAKPSKPSKPAARRPSRASRPAAKKPRAPRELAPSTSTPEAARGAKTERIALLIDADNVSQQYLPTLRDFVGETILISARAYGDFSNRLHNWRVAAQDWPALELVEQRNYTAGKNATDMRLTIDAVKLLAGPTPPTTLVFVTNDSDFTPVVEDAKKDGVRIVVMGERPHRALRSAAHHYINVAELRTRLESSQQAKSDPKVALALLSQAIRTLTPTAKKAVHELLDQFDKLLPEIRFAAAPPTRPTREPRPARESRPAREPRAPRENREPRERESRGQNPGQDYRDTPNLSPAQQAQGKAEADQRRNQLLGRRDITNALIDVATGLAPEGEWIKVEVIKKYLIQEYPGLERDAPRYAKFYRMLEDTGCFEVQLQGSTVMAKLTPQPSTEPRAN